MATTEERLTALEGLLKAAGFHEPTCEAIVTAGGMWCDCWIATTPLEPEEG